MLWSLRIAQLRAQAPGILPCQMPPAAAECAAVPCNTLLWGQLAVYKLDGRSSTVTCEAGAQGPSAPGCPLPQPACSSAGFLENGAGYRENAGRRRRPSKLVFVYT